MFEALRANISRKFSQIEDAVGNIRQGIENASQSFSTAIRTAELIQTNSSNSASVPATSAASAYPSAPSPLPDPVPPEQFIPGQTPPPWPNELQGFSTFNTILSLAALSADEINDPDNTYRRNGPQNLVIQNGGGAASKKVRTAYEEALGKDVEFFIDNLEFIALLTSGEGSGNTNATSFSFTVHEPYSMGLFLQALQLAAVSAGYKNYIAAPFLLTIDFVGFDENNNSGIAPYARRMLPIRLRQAKFEVTGSGSTYACKAMPWNEAALMDLTQAVRNDITITGRTVTELLQSGTESLTSILNQRELDEQARGIKSVGDSYVIMFPTTRDSETSNPIRASESFGESATVDPSSLVSDGMRTDLLDYYRRIRGTTADEVPEGFDTFLAEFQQRVQQQSNLGLRIKAYAESETNFIGNCRIVESFVSSGVHPTGRNGFAYNEETGIYERNGVELQLSEDTRRFTFKAGTRIQDIITEIVLISDFGQSLLQELENVERENGMISWFKIETQVYSVPDNSQVDRSGNNPSVFVFRVVPYRVHHSMYMAPNAPGVGYGNLKAEAAKQYNYIYTGKNQDILDFNIEYNYQFFTAQRADSANAGAGTRLGAANQAVQTNPEQVVVPGGEPNANLPPEGTAQTAQQVSVIEISGGTAYDNSAIGVARMFQEQFNNSDVDLVRTQLTIMGDPFYISDSGLGNFNAAETSYRAMNSNGSINYQQGEVDINLLFRTPIDYNESGGMDFPEDTRIVEPFSGLYKVTKVKNTISKNQFVQVLTLLRRKNQQDGATSGVVGAVRSGTTEESINDALVSLQNAANLLQQADPINVAAAQAELARALPVVQDLGSFGDLAQSALESGTLGNLQASINTITGQIAGAVEGISDINLTQQIQSTAGDLSAAIQTATSAANQAAANARRELSNIGNRLPPTPTDLSGPF